MFCKKCGAIIADDAVFCYNCGNPVENSEQNTVPLYTERTAPPQQGYTQQNTGQYYAAPDYGQQTVAADQSYTQQNYGQRYTTPDYTQQTVAADQSYTQQNYGQRYAAPDAQQTVAADQSYTQQNYGHHYSASDYGQQTVAAEQTFAPQFDQQSYDPQYGAQPAVKKKRKLNKKVLIGIISGVVVVAAAIFMIIWFNPSMKTLEKSYLHNVIKSYKKGQDNMTNCSYTVDMEFGQYLAEVAEQEGVDLTWLRSADIDFATNKSKNDLGYSAKVSLNDTDITTMKAVYNTKDNNMLLTLDGLSDKAARYNYTASASKLLQMDQDKLYKVLEKYYGMAWDSVKHIDSSKGVFTANGVSQNCKVFTATLSEYECMEIASKILTKAVDDKDLKEIIMAVYDPSMNIEGEYSNAEEFYAYVQRNMRESLSNINENMRSASARTAITIIDFVSGRSIIGRKIVVNNGGSESNSVTFGYARKGKEIGMEVSVNGETYAYGKGTVSGASVTGQIDIVNQGQHLATVTLEKYNVLKNKGVVEVKLSKSSWYQITSDEKTASMLEPVAFKFNMKGKDFDLDINAGDKMIMHAAVKKGKKQKVSIDQSMPQVDSAEWGETINADELRNRLKSAGASEKFLSDIGLNASSGSKSSSSSKY